MGKTEGKRRKTEEGKIYKEREKQRG